MKDVFAARKVSKALELCIQLAKTVLSLIEEDLKDDTCRSLLLDQPEKTLSLVRSIDTLKISELTHEQLCHVMEDAEYDPASAARESESGLFLDLHQMLMGLRCQLEAGMGRTWKQPAPVAHRVVPGQSYMAFEVATRLCRQGKLTVLHVNEDKSASLQLPVISSDFILEEYKSHCSRFKLPANRISIIASEPPSSSSSSSSFPSIAEQLLQSASDRLYADFLVLGAVGKAGPAVDQIGHVPRELLSIANADATSKINGSSNSPMILIVPPAPVNAMLYRQYVFVIAVDRSPAGVQCLNAALKLARPSYLVRVVHFYKKPIVGDYDEQRFEYYQEVLAASKMSGSVDILPLDDVGATIAESVQDYVSNQNASYLIVGRTGERHAAVDNTESSTTISSFMGRIASALLFSPRCAICICP